jgi:hypothetical protein
MLHPTPPHMLVHYGKLAYRLNTSTFFLPRQLRRIPNSSIGREARDPLEAAADYRSLSNKTSLFPASSASAQANLAACSTFG